MKLHRTPARRRGGFTMVELIVVITIILVLISLLTGAVYNAMLKMDETKTRTEMHQLAASMSQFQADFGLQNAPPPSRLWLDNSGSYSQAPTAGATGLSQAQITQLAADSQSYLKRVWPRLQYPINWGGSSNSVVLEGEQC